MTVTRFEVSYMFHANADENEDVSGDNDVNENLLALIHSIIIRISFFIHSFWLVA